MKRLVCAVAVSLIALTGFAQTDSTKAIDSTKITDTVKVGNFIIIKKKGNETYSESDKYHRHDPWDYYSYIFERRRPRNKNISTNWFIFDLGFANYRDNTNYPDAQTGPYLTVKRASDGPVNQSTMHLNPGKSSNVNIWFFMQKLNLSKHVVNLKYGLGLEMYNFRYDSRVSFRSDPQPTAFVDSIAFTKNKLFVEYLTIPFMLNFNTTPNTRRGLSFSVGMSAGYLIASRNKQISGERGKQKYKGDLMFEPWRIATIGEIGLGPVRLYGSYSINTLQKGVTKMEQYPYTVGIRFSNW
jgi:hypothetical protein